MTSPRVLAAAVLDVLRAGSPAFTVYDALVPKTPVQAYVVVYPDGGQSVGERYSSVRTSNRLRFGFTAICVGDLPAQALETAELVRGRLVGLRLDNSPATSPLSEDSDSGLLRDDSVPDDIRFYVSLRFTMTTSREIADVEA